MSFGRRLRLFFIGIVVIPMIVLAVVLVQISRESRDGKADERLAAGLETARVVYDEGLSSAAEESRRIANESGSQLEQPSSGSLDEVARRELTSPVIAGVTILGPSGEELASSGPETALALGESEVSSTGGSGVIGTVRVAAFEPGDLIDRINDLTTRDVVLATDDGVLASTVDIDLVDLPDSSDSGAVDLEVAGTGDSRAAALALSGAPDGTRLVILTPVEAGFFASEPLVAVVLAAFFAVAFVLIVLLLRNLQRRIASMLEAARRIGEGNFDHRVPVEGDDEMAGLARELNRMSDRLSTQMGELERQRGELDESVRRIGEAFASGLDRRALLGVLAETAISACGAEGGRVITRHRGDFIATESSPDPLEGVLAAAGEAAWADQGEGTADEGGCHAISAAMIDRRDRREVVCVLAVARRGDPFSDREREVLRYLIGQTVTSIENIELHERVSEQAFTDSLTGIPNKRHFDDWLEREVARAGRFGGELSLILLDIDDFKVINDTAGHQQGDRVLERIGRLLEAQSRAVDLAARYGGEEFVLALPGTGRDGAVEVAERLRSAIEASPVEAMGGGAPASVTASLGVGTLPADGEDSRELIAAADRALYGAKRTGKNRVVAAGLDEGLVPQGNRLGRRN